jgi:hypothetical protein
MFLKEAATVATSLILAHLLSKCNNDDFADISEECLWDFPNHRYGNIMIK